MCKWVYNIEYQLQWRRGQFSDHSIKYQYIQLFLYGIRHIGVLNPQGHIIQSHLQLLIESSSSLIMSSLITRGNKPVIIKHVKIFMLDNDDYFEWRAQFPKTFRGNEFMLFMDGAVGTWEL